MRVVMDCREFPSESGCSLTIAGEEQAVLTAAAQHAVSVHGHSDDAQLREQLRAALRPEQPTTSGYGTVMMGRMRAGRAEWESALVGWDRERQVPGFRSAALLFADDGATVVNLAMFDSADSYRRLAADPGQDEWYRHRLAPLLDGDPTWTDGTCFFLHRQIIALPAQGQQVQPEPTRG